MASSNEHSRDQIHYTSGAAAEPEPPLERQRRPSSGAAAEPEPEHEPPPPPPPPPPSAAAAAYDPRDYQNLHPDDRGGGVPTKHTKSKTKTKTAAGKDAKGNAEADGSLCCAHCGAAAAKSVCSQVPDRAVLRVGLAMGAARGPGACVNGTQRIYDREMASNVGTPTSIPTIHPLHPLHHVVRTGDERVQAGRQAG